MGKEGEDGQVKGAIEEEGLLRKEDKNKEKQGKNGESEMLSEGEFGPRGRINPNI